MRRTVHLIVDHISDLTHMSLDQLRFGISSMERM